MTLNFVLAKHRIMNVSISTYDMKPWKVARIKGRIDAFNDKPFLKAVEQMIQSGSHWLALDLSGVDFMGFQAMQELRRLSIELRNRAGDMVLVSPTALVRRHLDSFANQKGLRIYRNFEELQTGLFFTPRSEFAAHDSIDRDLGPAPVVGYI